MAADPAERGPPVQDGGEGRDWDRTPLALCRTPFPIRCLYSLASSVLIFQSSDIKCILAKKLNA
jgi:hypothetical protein